MKGIIWIGSSKKDITAFPKRVRKTFGEALMFAQCGEKHKNAKILKYIRGGSVLEIIEDASSSTFRLVYRSSRCIACISKEIQDRYCHAKAGLKINRNTVAIREASV